MTAIDPKAGLDVSHCRAPLEGWLAQRWPDRAELTVDELSAPTASGFSNETVFFRASWHEGAQRCAKRYVARIEPVAEPIFPDQTGAAMPSVEVQFRAMEAVAAASAVPLAGGIGFERDPRFLGRPFFVMDFIEGDVLTDNPIYTLVPGFFLEGTPEKRRRLFDTGLSALAGLHAIDWKRAGLEWLAPAGARPGFGRQLEIYDRYTRTVLAGRRHAVLAAGFDWLKKELPAEGQLGVSWGDARPGNMIFKEFTCAAVTDWEGVAIGPPELDLGWWLMFDRFAHESSSAERPEGEPTREEQRALYAAKTGRPCGDTHYFEVFAALRFTAVMIVNCDRMTAAGRIPASMQMAIHNPATQLLADMLELPYSWMREAGLQ
ncbi:MAG: phosphotransferase family protein [Candidatus Binatia bacterium]